MQHSSAGGRPAELRDRANCGVGVVADLQGFASHRIVQDALQILERLDHRGARGAEENTGDGAGILLQKPDAFFRQQVPGLPPAPAYAVGQLFLPRDRDQAAALRRRIETVLTDEGFCLLGWRPVPTDNTGLGHGALETEPAVEQVFVSHNRRLEGPALDRRVFVLRRALELAVAKCDLPGREAFYICSLDRRQLVYKGLLANPQLRGYYPDLEDTAVESALALVHARFSTNTLGTWALAHPYRVLVHNGEINTYRGNLNRLRAHEAGFDHPELGPDLARLRPWIDTDTSDTALLDTALDLLMASGRSLPHALRMLIPEAWQKDLGISGSRRDWYDFHSTVMEPWDGPALAVASDRERVAAVLDRNGFRPCRYDITVDGRLILASEAGVLDTPAAEIRQRRRLAPGEILAVDPEAGGLLDDAAVFSTLADARYGRWLRGRPRLSDHAPPRDAERGEVLNDLVARQSAAGYTVEHIDRFLRPMADDGKDPVGAMGDDTPPASLSESRRSLFDYFKQQFAQVSNPAIDYLRESLVTSLECHLGPQPNLLTESADHCRRIHLESPVLTNGALTCLRGLDARRFHTYDIDISFRSDESLLQALERIEAEAEAVAGSDTAILCLTDRRTGPERLAIPGLLAVGAVHQHLIRTDRRLQVGLVVEAADACTVHHVCTLLGFGADAVNPYLGLASVAAIAGDEQALTHYLAALDDGILKVMSKMGISTVDSYRGAQLFEALGLADEVVERCFTGSVSRIGGADFARLEADVRDRHSAAWGPSTAGNPPLASGGTLYWRRDGEHHDWDPATIGMLQAAVRNDDETLYRRFSACIDAAAGGPYNLRGMLSLEPAGPALPLDRIEPAGEIIRRFFSGAMSLGALSPEAHEAVAIGMQRAGGTAHTGEGGEPEERFGTEAECGNKQIASGRFGVTAAYLARARQIEIKIAQGAKPGEGGQLPGEKVAGLIARLRFTTPGVGLISPPPHHDIYSIEDLAQLIHDLRCASPQAEIHVKLVASAGVGTIAAGVAKAGADAILIAGDAGGTGAAAKTSIKSAGVPWELGLAEAQQVLVENRLRSRVRLRVDGGLKTGRDIIVAAMLGAEDFGFGMAAVITLGCIMLRKCHCNTCSVGIATQDPELRKLFPGRPEHLSNYLRYLAAEVRDYLADLGVCRLDDLIGRVDLLKPRHFDDPRLAAIDLGWLLRRPEPSDAPRRTRAQAHTAADAADQEYLAAAIPALDGGRPVVLDGRIDNRRRAVGTRLSYELTRRHGSAGLADGTITLNLKGVAGQSLGAFVNRGIAIHLTGAANDYVAKGLSGGRVVVRAPADAGYDPTTSATIGNAVLYGATGGSLYCQGRAGERFAVRNSGAVAVVEGVGDHGCEYMTGGALLILGPVGRNFATGMTGGEVYLLTEDDDSFRALQRRGMQVDLLQDRRDRALVRRLLDNHYHYTGSSVAAALLDGWPGSCRRLRKITPERYATVVSEALARGEDPRTPLPPAATPEPAEVEIG
ncbi:MAG: glutamate synthase large subunit [Gammaproteobacteria bacterium]